MQPHLLKLGKAPARKDRRTLKLKSILLPDLPKLPTEFRIDPTGMISTPMYLNDQLGDCVIAGRAHATRRFEYLEQGSIIAITDDEVRKTYFAETGGEDSGLVMLDSLNRWRQEGWKLGGRRVYKIHAYAAIRPRDRDDVRACVYLLCGCYAGVALPASAQAQTGPGKIWEVTSGPGARAGTWGGHCIYLCGYNITGPVCITWGAFQQMTWAWWCRYADEAYGIVDAKDSWLAASSVDFEKLEKYLNRIAA